VSYCTRLSVEAGLGPEAWGTPRYHLPVLRVATGYSLFFFKLMRADHEADLALTSSAGVKKISSCTCPLLTS